MEALTVSNRIKTIAKRLARTSEYHERVGAVIVKGRRMLSSGCNKNKTHTIIRNKIDPYSPVNKLHAEMAAILKARTDLTGSKLYILRLCPAFRHGTGMSKPCNLCMRLIKDVGIKEIIYTTGNPKQQWVREKV